MPRDLADPPELPPEVLWRSLLPPRPQRRISYRIRGAENTPLIVKAVPAMVEALAWDTGAELYPPDDLFSTPELRERAGAMGIISEVLWTPDGRAFHSLPDMRDLSEDEIRDLSHEVLVALADIAPSNRRSNGRAWAAVLKEGAAHPSNIGEAASLSCCVDLIYGGGQLPRPDRYWGLPLNQLLDGHWMAFHAARELAKDRR